MNESKVANCQIIPNKIHLPHILINRNHSVILRESTERTAEHGKGYAPHQPAFDAGPPVHVQQQHHSGLHSQEHLEDGQQAAEHAFGVKGLRVVDVPCRRRLVQVALSQNDAIYVTCCTSDTRIVPALLVHSAGPQIATGTPGHGQQKGDEQVEADDAEHDQPLRQQEDDVVEGAFEAALGSDTWGLDKDNKDAADDQVGDPEALQDAKDAQVL